MEKTAHPVDIQVGKMVRFYRWAQKITAKELGDAVEKPFQQIRKYEAGTNRISASVLSDIAKALQVNLQDFFFLTELGEKIDPLLDQFLKDKVAVQDIAATLKITKANVRQTLIALAHALAEPSEE